MSFLSQNNFARAPPNQAPYCSEFCKVTEDFLFNFDPVQGPMTEAISTCEYIYNMFSVRFSIMYTVYAVSIHLSLLIECEIVRAGEG